MNQLNEMKVAVALLDAAAAAATTEEYRWLDHLSDVAQELADAPHLFREDAVRRVAQILIDAADMEGLYEDDADGSASVGPRPTKWMYAEVDEVWELVLEGGATGAYIFDGAAFIGEVRPGGGNSIQPNSRRIVSGRRVWMPR